MDSRRLTGSTLAMILLICPQENPSNVPQMYHVLQQRLLKRLGSQSDVKIKEAQPTKGGFASAQRRAGINLELKVRE